MHSADAIWAAAVKFSIPDFICNRVSPGKQNQGKLSLAARSMLRVGCIITFTAASMQMEHLLEDVSPLSP